MSTIKNESLGINRVPFSRMLKSEMADYAERIMDIVESNEPESELINHVFGLLKTQNPQIKLLRISYGVDTARLKVDSLKADMMLTISALKLRVRMLKRSNLELDLHVVENAINSHLRYLDTSKNDKELIQKVSGFLDLPITNEALLTALEEFDLMKEVNSLKIALNVVKEALDKRVKLLSKRSKAPTRGVMKGMHDAINDLFKAIEVSHLVGYPISSEEGAVASDFTEMINELRQLSDMYNRSISIRLANNKRKADKVKEGEGSGEEGGKGAGEPIATAMYFGEEEGDENESIISPIDENDTEDDGDGEEMTF